jgi:phytoene dehydrogenase-like protein
MQEEGIRLELNCSANQLIVENGKAVGIKMAEGQEKRADLVVFDADPQKYTEI